MTVSPEQQAVYLKLTLLRDKYEADRSKLKRKHVEILQEMDRAYGDDVMALYSQLDHNPMKMDGHNA